MIEGHGDAAKPLWITELAWVGAARQLRDQQGPGGPGEDADARLQADPREPTAWNIQRLFCTTGVSRKRRASSCSFCGSAGLLNFNRTPKPASGVQGLHHRRRRRHRDDHPGPAQGSTSPTRPRPSSSPPTSWGSTFACKVDANSFLACASPFTPKAQLAAGPHTFSVRAVDAAGNASVIVSRSFRVNTH